MAYQLKAYTSVGELLRYVTVEVERTRSQLYKAVEASHEMRKRTDRAKKLQQAFFNGSKPTVTPSRGVRVGDLDVVVNAGADDELLALDLMTRTQNERLSALVKIRAVLTEMQKKGPQEYLSEISCLVIENDGVPRKIMFQEESFQSPAMASLLYGDAPQLSGGADSHPEQSKLGDVQLQMASIVQESGVRPTAKLDKQPSSIQTEDRGSSEYGSQGRLDNFVRFLTAKPVHN